MRTWMSKVRCCGVPSPLLYHHCPVIPGELVDPKELSSAIRSGRYSYGTEYTANARLFLGPYAIPSVVSITATHTTIEILAPEDPLARVYPVGTHGVWYPGGNAGSGGVNSAGMGSVLYYDPEVHGYGGERSDSSMPRRLAEAMSTGGHKPLVVDSTSPTLNTQAMADDYYEKREPYFTSPDPGHWPAAAMVWQGRGGLDGFGGYGPAPAAGSDAVWLGMSQGISRGAGAAHPDSLLQFQPWHFMYFPLDAATQEHGGPIVSDIRRETSGIRTSERYCNEVRPRC